MILDILSKNDLEHVRQASLEILERIGVNLQHEGARGLLAEHGCSVQGERVRIPTPLVEGLIAQVPRSFRICGRKLDHAIDYGGGQRYFRPTSGLAYVRDLAAGERRSPSVQDARDLVRIQDRLPNIDSTSAMVHAKDIPPEMVSILSFVTTCQFSDKPTDATVVSAPEVKAIHLIAAAIRGSEVALRENPLTLIYVSPTSPLRYAYEQADAVLETARLGMPLGVMPVPIVGVSSAITLAGMLAQQTAEVLSGVVLAYLINPGLPIVYCTRVCPGEMSAGGSLSSGGSPAGGLARAASMQLAHYLGMPANGGGLLNSGKTLDEQVGVEKALSGLMVALAGGDMLSGAGAIEDGLSASYEQLVIDDEIISMIHRLLRVFQVNEETLAIEVLQRVMDGADFLAEPHTRKFLRAGELWQAQLADRQAFYDWQQQGAKRIEARAAERVREILDTHEEDTLAPDVQREIDRIVKAAERELVTS